MALSISSNINILPDEEEKKLESNTSTETSEDTLFKSELNINDIIIIGQCIEASQQRGKILVNEMANVGILFNRIDSFVSHITISNKKEEDLTEKELEIKDKLITNLNIDDLVIFKSFLDAMIKRETFKEEETEVINNLNEKIGNALESYSSNLKKDENTE